MKVTKIRGVRVEGPDYRRYRGITARVTEFGRGRLLHARLTEWLSPLQFEGGQLAAGDVVAEVFRGHGTGTRVALLHSFSVAEATEWTLRELAAPRR